MKFLFPLVLCLVAVQAVDLPPVTFGSFASECEIPVETPIDFGPGFFEIPADVIIRFNVPNIIRMVHLHWGPPADLPPNGFTLTAIESETFVVNDDGSKGKTVNVLRDPPSTGAGSRHMAVKLPIFDPETSGPVDPADENDIIQGQVTAIYEDANGNEFRSEPQLYPKKHMNLCCPNSLPSPPGQIPIDHQVSWDSNPALGAVEIDGGDVFVNDDEGRLWSYFCHEGDYMSCFILPDGFSDPNLERLQPVGGIATFVEDGTGEEVEFECVFRETGNALGDDRTQELSGGFRKRLDILEAIHPAPVAIPKPGIGIEKAECRMTLDFPFVFEADPTLTAVDAAHTAGSQPFQWPADISITGINILKEANRLHSHWGVPVLPEDSTLTLSGFEVTSVQDGNILHFESTPPDVNDIHVIIDGSEEDVPISTSIVAVYFDQDGNTVRSEPAFWPEATNACCPGNHPRATVPVNTVHPGVQSEIDGGSFGVVTSDGNSYTYFCVDGQYMACQNVPDGFEDVDNNQRYQPIGGIGVFVNLETRIPTKFVCLLSDNGDGETLPGQVDPLLAGRFFPLTTAFSDFGVPVEAPAAAIDPSASDGGIFIAISVALAIALISIVGYTIFKKNKQPRNVREVQQDGQNDTEMVGNYAPLETA